MKFLADENFPKSALKILQDDGLNIIPIPPESEGASDHAVLALAMEEMRILVTFDKDFGELLFRRSAGSVGVILFRLAPAGREAVTLRICEVLQSQHEFSNALTVVEPDRIRSRRFTDILRIEQSE
jgi:predicted nuclease of predicted toxin-antitoxin system